METFALFGDQSVSKIMMDFFSASAAEKERIQIKPRMRDLDLRSSAEKGVISALILLEASNQIEPTNHYLFCEFADDQANQTATGQSAGLAFALKFVQALYAKTYQRDLPYNIAATGALSGGTRKAEVIAVEQINEKIQAVLPHLKPGDKLFYPAGNRQDLSARLLKTLARKKIHHYPVASVEQAIKVLLGEIDTGSFRVPIPVSGLKILRWLALALIIILFSVGAFFIVHTLPAPDCAARVQKLLTNGEFIRAQSQLTKCLQKSDSSQPALVELQALLQTNLNLTLNFAYIKAHPQSAPALTAAATLAQVVLGDSDGYRFEIRPEATCFVYLFQFDSQQGVELLCPLSDFATENHRLNPGQSYFIPSVDRYFYLNNTQHQGTITLYFLASFWRARDLENAYERYSAANAPNKIKYKGQLLARIQHWQQQISQGAKSPFFKKEYFLQE